LSRSSGSIALTMATISDGANALRKVFSAYSPRTILSRSMTVAGTRRRRLTQQAEALRTDKQDILAGTLRDRMGAARLRVDRP
jgi:hypothetical protein